MNAGSSQIVLFAFEASLNGPIRKTDTMQLNKVYAPVQSQVDFAHLCRDRIRLECDHPLGLEDLRCEDGVVADIAANVDEDSA